MDTKKPNKDQTIVSLREMIKMLLEKNEHLRRQIMALKELAIDINLRYNEDVLKIKGLRDE